MADVNTNNINAVKTLKDQGKIKYVLGFNEPNRADQSKPEQLDYVKRYSWFSGDPKSAQMWSLDEITNMQRPHKIMILCGLCIC